VSANEEDVMSEPTEGIEGTETAYVSETPAPAAAATATATKARPAKIVGKGGHLAQTVGRRKEAIVRVRLLPGTGVFTLNGRPMENYFPNKVHQQLIREPLVQTENGDAYDVIANLRGGGITGQAGALRLAVARALIEVDPDDRPVLKKAGFLTRDSRVTESKKYGLKKARKAPQYSKR
jgi:small subunit ribosomal protein S9